MKVIIIEDEIRIREGIEKLLAKLDQELEIVGEADNGEEGLNLVRKLRPDFIITDIRMPRMDGLEMLTRMSDEGIGSKAIVLSAYSEFDYARRAMKLGITEYLLKPIAYNDFAQAIENIKQQVEKDKQEKPAQIGTIEQIFHALISGRIEIDDNVADYLQNNYQIGRDQTFAIVCCYLGPDHENVWEKTKRYFQQALSMYKGLSYTVVEAVYKNSLIIALYHYEDAGDVERWIQYQLLKHSPEKISVGWIEVKGIEKLKSGLDTLYPYMDWNISLDQEVIISYPKITNVQTSSCIYPIDLEAKAKGAVCASDWAAVSALANEFHDNFRDGKIYVPREIKESYVRFLWSILGIAKELGCMEKKDLEQQKLLGMIMNAKMREELVQASDLLLGTICSEEADTNITHLTVKRVTSLIHEFYRSGITLEEIGYKLNMTPEYLGTLFHREMGVTFSSYMKNCRINKAKELLCSTQLKLYEISERVGYSDSKYFSKVFREITGQLPNEYRRSYK
ncbi:MAG: response regulator [Clostridiaceae bacterium]|nr:response regulator [Clostridiaceae bacterium]